MEVLTRRCQTCGRDKPLSEFYARRQVEGTFYRTSCKVCLREAAQRRYRDDPEWRARKRTANRAWQERNPDYQPQYGKAYYERRKSYYAERSKTWAQANRGRRVAIRRKHVYGITQDEFDALLARQGGKCAICRTELGPENWSVDHDHTTRLVRGLLCRDCNVGLGHFADNPSRLRKAIIYLRSVVNGELQIKT